MAQDFIIFQFCMHSNKPKIGISLSETLELPTKRWPVRKRFDYIKHEYYEAVAQAGGIPIILVNIEPPSLLEPLWESLDGLLITGGGDMHPSHFGQNPHPMLGETTKRRDELELAVFKYFFERQKPIMGICRGHQVINIALGGTLHQDLSCLKKEVLTHVDSEQSGKVMHKVTVDKDSRLFKIVGASIIETNSSHHQVIDKLGRDLRAVAFASDGVIEAIEHQSYPFLMGIQWHPEGIIEMDHSRKLFSALIEKSTK